MPEQPGSHLKVALDATPLLGAPTGVGVFTQCLLGALDRRGDLDLKAFAVSWRRRDQLPQHVPEGVSTAQRAMPARPLTKLWSRTNLAPIEHFIGPADVVHGTNFTVPPTKRAGQVVTVHDLTFFRFPEMCQPNTLRYPALIQRALRRGAVVQTPSNYVAEEVRDHFSVAPHQVVAVHSGIPALSPPDLVGASEVIDLKRPYILSVGTAEPRKDLPGLVKAFEEVAQRDPDVVLVLAGPPGWGSDDLNEAIISSGLRGRILQPGYLTSGVLAALLLHARALAYPSLYEGFGFPPLQAMAAGVPVVTTRAGALNEIVGGAALMVEPRDIEGLAHGLRIATSDEAQRTVLITAGLTRVKDFSWDETAARMVEIYQRVSGR